MKTIVSALLLAAIFSVAAISMGHAGSSCYYIGNTMYCNGDDGSRATGYNIGGTTYYNGTDSNRQTWRQSCYYIGQTRYCN